VGIGLIALLASVWAGTYLHAWWISPEHRLRQFAAAACRHAPTDMLALADAQEVRELGLTPGRLQSILAAASGAARSAVPRDLAPLPYNVDQSRYNRHVEVRFYNASGVPLVGADGGPATSTIIAYRTGAGWKICISRYIYGLMIARYGMPFRKERFAELCRRHGVQPALFFPEDSKWEQLGAVLVK
jgi:hypothetical protein